LAFQRPFKRSVLGGPRNPTFLTNIQSAVAPVGRQSSISHLLGVAELDAVGYTLDSMGRRTAITRPGANNASYVDDAAGQVTAFDDDGWNLIEERVFNASGAFTEQHRYSWGRDLFI
jgi:hypothetical protein